MSFATSITLDEYLSRAFKPDCDFVNGEVLARNVGQKRHSYAQAQITIWFGRQTANLRLQPLTELLIRVSPNRIRVPDILLSELPLPNEEVLTSPPYLCIEVMSPDDTFSSMQEDPQR